MLPFKTIDSNIVGSSSVDSVTVDKTIIDSKTVDSTLIDNNLTKQESCFSCPTNISNKATITKLLSQLTNKDTTIEELKSRLSEELKPVEINQYVPYETKTFQGAYIWATKELATKYPGSIDIINTLDSLLKQKLNS
jgi:hypothetical protein